MLGCSLVPFEEEEKGPGDKAILMLITSYN